MSRGVHFEIVYSPMIRDASARRSTITNANLLVELCQGKVCTCSESVMSHYVGSCIQFLLLCLLVMH